MKQKNLLKWGFLCLFCALASIRAGAADKLVVGGDENNTTPYTGTDWFKAVYIGEYTPDTNGTLEIHASAYIYLYTDETCATKISGGTEDYANGKYITSYTLEAGTTYYAGVGSYSGDGYYWATFAEEDDGSEEVETSFAIVSITLDDGTDLTGSISDGKLELATLAEGMVIKISCTNADGNYLFIVFGTIGDDENTFLTQTGDRLSATDGVFTWTGGWDYSLIQGYEYPVVVTLYDAITGGNVVATETILTLVGTSENPYSSASLKSIDPQPYEYDTSNVVGIDSDGDFEFTMTFSEPVLVDETKSNCNLEGISGNIKASFKSITATEPNDEGYATVWVFTVANSTVETYITENAGDLPVHIYVTGQDGKYIEGNDVGSFYFTYQVEINGTGVSGDTLGYTFDPANHSTVSKISTITVSYSSGIQGGNYVKQSYIQNDETGEIVAYSTGWEDPNEDSSVGSAAVTFATNDGQPVTEPGDYTVVFVQGYFTGGDAEKGTDFTSPKFYLNYTVASEEETTVEITVELAGSTLDEGITVSVEGGSVTFTTDENASYEDIVLKDAEGNIVSTCTGTKPDEANGTVTIYFENLDEDLSDLEEGEYTLTLEIPEGLFVVTIDDETYTNEETTAEYTYTVNAETSNYELVYTPADDDEVGKISTLQILEANGQELLLNGSEADIVVYDADGNKVTTGVDYGSEAIKGANDIEIGYDIPFEDEITTAGTYTIVIPKDFVLYGDWDGPGNDEVTLTVTISGEESVEGEGGSGEGGTETGISAINAAIADGASVYTLSGQKVNAPVKGNVYIIKSAGSVKKMLVK